MKVIEQYTQTHINPMYAVNPADFGAKPYCYDIDNKGNFFAKWDEEVGYFALLDFDKTLLWQINTPICSAKLDVAQGVIWLVQRDDDEQVTVLACDYQGNIQAKLTIEDKLYRSAFIITLLPEPKKIALNFGGGQDGTQSYFLQLVNHKLQVVRELGADLCLLFTYDNDSKAVLLNFYEGVIFTVSYPKLTPIQQFNIPETMSYGELAKITDEVWLFTDGYHYRHYLFDSQTMQIIDEIVVSGYEPAMDKEGEISSNISGMEYADGKIIFRYWELVGEYPNTKEKNWWGIADFDVENWK